MLVWLPGKLRGMVAGASNSGLALPRPHSATHSLPRNTMITPHAPRLPPPPLPCAACRPPPPGHARVYVAFDVLYRLLRQLQYEVQYVRNFTDVDDKIIKRASETGEDPLALAGRFITEFHEDMAALGCLPPTVRSEGG